MRVSTKLEDLIVLRYGIQLIVALLIFGDWISFQHKCDQGSEPVSFLLFQRTLEVDLLQRGETFHIFACLNLRTFIFFLKIHPQKILVNFAVQQDLDGLFFWQKHTHQDSNKFLLK